MGFREDAGIRGAKPPAVNQAHLPRTNVALGASVCEIMRTLALTNIEAYDAWLSEEERPYLKMIVHPLTSPIFWALLHLKAVRRYVFSIAAHRQEVLTDDVLNAFVRPLISTPARWQRLRRFFRWQLDRDHNQVTVRAVESMRKFNKPTLILWGQRDGNFGEAIAHRLSDDIPGVVRIEWLEDSGHLPMLEEPQRYADAVASFVSEHAGAEVT